MPHAIAARAMIRSSRTLPLIVATALFMENMDSTVIATSLPAIAHDLATDPIVLKLAFTAYLLSLTVFIPVSGWMADRFGAKHVFRAAILVFMGGSIACGYAQSLGFLVVARAVQGMGGAMMVPVGRIIILRGVPKSALVNALAWLTIPALIGPLLGPTVGGFITTYFNWRWIFWMNIPIGLLGLLAATRWMPANRVETVAPLDVSGFLLSGLGLSSMVSGFTILGRELLPLWLAVVLIATGACAIGLYVRHARRIPNPILDLRLFANPTFRVGVTSGSLYRIGVGASPFLLPLLMQLGFGFTAFQSGLLTSAAALGSIAMKFGASRLLRRFGFRRLLLINGSLSCLVMASPAGFTGATPVALMFVIIALGGYLRSLQFTSLNVLAYSDVSNADASRATSLYSVAQQLSLSAGVALAAIILELTQAYRGDSQIGADDFAIAFVVVSLVAALSLFHYFGLKENAGASVLARPHENVHENQPEK